MLSKEIDSGSIVQEMNCFSNLLKRVDGKLNNGPV